MRITVVRGFGYRTSIEISRETQIGRSVVQCAVVIDRWPEVQCRLAPTTNRAGVFVGWKVTAVEPMMTHNDRTLAVGAPVALAKGDVLQLGTVKILIEGFTIPAVGADLDATEVDLLGRIADGDCSACRVLADHWILHGDEARGTFVHLQHEAEARVRDMTVQVAESDLWHAHGDRWRAPAVAAGFAADRLSFERGFLQFPLVLPKGDALHGAPDLFRISPRIYRLDEALDERFGAMTFAGTSVSPIGEGELVLIECSRKGDHEAFQGRVHVRVPPPIATGLRREGRVTVLPWNERGVLN